MSTEMIRNTTKRKTGSQASGVLTYLSYRLVGATLRMNYTAFSLYHILEFINGGVNEYKF